MDAAGLFLALGTQWRRCATTGARTGLIYEAVAPTARMLEVKVGPTLLADLQAMEGEALAVLAAEARR